MFRSILHQLKYAPNLPIGRPLRSIALIAATTSSMMFVNQTTSSVRCESVVSSLETIKSDLDSIKTTLGITAKDASRLDEVISLWNGIDMRTKFQKNPDFDNMLREKFLSLHTDVMAGKYDKFISDPDHALAIIIVLDQFSRNMFRNSPKSFASDKKALFIAKYAIDNGYDNLIAKENRVWVYMPFMHSENLQDQNKCVELFTKASMDTDFAMKHKVIVEKFGCFPHRNQVLGRESTPEMIAYVKEHGGF